MNAAVAKEIRALAPTWLAAVAVVGASAFGDPKIMFVGMVAGGLGAVTLGALSIGHEYTHRTLGVLLAQPVDRRRLLLTKLSVLIVMLGALAAVAWLGPVSYEGFSRLREARGVELFSFVALCALCLAPCLTMLSRSALAGTVFTIAIPGAMWTLTELIGLWQYGQQAPERSGVQVAIFMSAVTVLSVVSAIATVRMFLRLEVIEARGAEVQLPDWARASDREHATGGAPRRPSHPVWLLIRKELRLQQMSLLVAALYVGNWAIAAVLERHGTDSGGLVRGPLTLMYCGMMSILIGSLASAEERQLGTHPTQLLLPMAAWKQWAVKAGTAIGLALVAGVGVSMFLHYADPSPMNAMSVRHWPAIAMGAALVVALTASSLYVSSLCDSGIRALILALPVGIVTGIIVRFMDMVLWSLRSPFFRQLLGSEPSGHAATISLVLDSLFGVLVVGFVALLLYLGFRNYRTLDRGAARIFRQAALILGVIAGGQVLLAGVWLLMV